VVTSGDAAGTALAALTLPAPSARAASGFASACCDGFRGPFLPRGTNRKAAWMPVFERIDVSIAVTAVDGSGVPTS
jgi:hypothetical protein